MRFTATILLICYCAISFAQNTTVGGPTTRTKYRGEFVFPTVKYVLPGFDSLGCVYFDSVNTKQWIGWNGTAWVSLSGGGGGNADSVTFATNYRLDTTRKNLYNRKVAYTDTASMLLPYLRSILGVKYTDTAVMLSGYYRASNPNGYITASAISGKVNYTDTASMLQPYYRASNPAGYITTTNIAIKVNYSDTAAMLAPYGRSAVVVKYTDTAGMLQGYYRANNPNGYITSAAISGKMNYTDTAGMLAPYLRKSDTATLSNRINLKLNISDTSGMLSGYQRKLQAVLYSDTATMLNPYQRSVFAVKYTDTATMLLPYLRKADSSTYQSKYRSDTMRNNVYAALNTKGPGTVTSIVAAGYVNGAGTYTSTGTFSPDTSAGKLATKTDIAGFITAAGSATISNKDYIPLYDSLTTVSTSYTPNANQRGVQITALANALLFNTPTGLLRHGKIFSMDINDNGTARSLTYSAAYRGTPPSTTTIGKTTKIVFQYNSNAAAWDFVGSKVNP